jgi:hypothetical protein
VQHLFIERVEDVWTVQSQPVVPAALIQAHGSFIDAHIELYILIPTHKTGSPDDGKKAGPL